MAHKIHATIPHWTRHAIVYQIYPRSFKDTNGDGIGDLKGIIEKLDYLNDGTENSLGIDAIWLSPIYSSPQKDFGYDVSDYYNIDPIFGDLKTFEELVRETHNRGMKIIMDFVPNHTSSEHPWFRESRSSRNNPKRAWYIWRDPKEGNLPPNNWLSVFGGSGWELDKETGQYYLHTHLVDQPDLNWRNPKVRKEMLSVLRFWLEKGVDGFRTDAIYYLIKDKKFRDDPPNPNFVQGQDDPSQSLLHIYSAWRPELFDTTNSFCEVLGSYGGRFMVSEAYLDVPLMNKFYKACSDKVHAPSNFNLIGMSWDAGVYKKFVDSFESSLEADDIPTYVLGNHDKSRVVTRLGRDRARLSAMILLTLRGMAFVYYGDELGMEDAVIPPEEIFDPFGKNLPQFKVGRDPERTPMQWDSSRFAGFSKAKPWIPFFSNPKTDNVKIELSDPKSTLSLYRKLIHFRKKSKALEEGDYQPVVAQSDKVFMFVRRFFEEKVLVVLNFSEKDERATCEIKKAKIVLSSYLDREEGALVETDKCTLRPYEGCIFTF